jgi:xanthosine utilization system XapX-like protein
MKNYKEIVAWGLIISILVTLIGLLAVTVNPTISLIGILGLIIFFIAGTFVNDWNYEDYDE